MTNWFEPVPAGLNTFLGLRVARVDLVGLKVTSNGGLFVGAGGREVVEDVVDVTNDGIGDVVNHDVVEVKIGGAISLELIRFGFVKVLIAGISNPDVGSFLFMTH